MGVCISLAVANVIGFTRCNKGTSHSPNLKIENLLTINSDLYLRWYPKKVMFFISYDEFYDSRVDHKNLFTKIIESLADIINCSSM